MLEKFWNQKLSGIPCAMCSIINGIFRKLHIRIHNIIVRGNVSIGKHSCVYPKTRFRYPSFISIGDNVYIGYNCNMLSSHRKNGRLCIEDSVSIDHDCTIDYCGNLSIGHDTHIAWGTYILTHSHGYDYKSEAKPEELVIGDNVFIGAKCVILPSVHSIGDHAVIGAGSVVTKEVPPYTIVAGNPAKIIRYIGRD